MSVRRRRLVLGAMAVTIAACATALPVWRGPRTDHFDGTHFRNEEPFEEQPPAYVARWQLTRRRGVWRVQRLPPAAPPPRHVGGREIRVTMVGHATVLIQMDSLNVLTDPVWSERIGPDEAVGTRRFREPGIRFDDLPPIDVVLLSHDHYDHMDLPTLRRLRERFHPRIVTGLGNPAYLARFGVPGAEQLDWWQSDSLAPGVRVTAVPAQHWSGRTLADHDERLWMGFVIEGRRDTVYFAGDTGWGHFLGELRARWGRFRLALLPIAPFIPRWYMKRKHLSPPDALEAALDIGAATSVAIHWGTFELGDDARDEAVDTLRAAIARLPARCRPPFATPLNGETVDVPLVDSAVALAIRVRSAPECDPTPGESPLQH